MHESILAFRRRRYLWVSLALVASAIAVYVWHEPQEPPNGGTALGYTLGALSLVLIVWLSWFGIRKRRYGSALGTVQGWLSAHVYLGLALVVLVLLHSGFQFGMNVHTLAFVLMTLVVASGLFGVYAYLRYPGQMAANRDGASRNELLLQLEDIDRRSLRVASDLGADFHELMTGAVQRTEIGTNLIDRLRGRDTSKLLLRTDNGTGVVPNAGQEAALDWLADQQSRARDADTAAAVGELSALVRSKRKLLRQLGKDLRLQAALEVWLYVHVPVTAAMLAAVTIHVLSVFIYW